MEKTKKQSKLAKVKAKYRAAKAKAAKAYNYGYKAGWEAREQMEGTLIEKVASKKGFSNGIRDNSKTKKYQKKLAKK